MGSVLGINTLSAITFSCSGGGTALGEQSREPEDEGRLMWPTGSSLLSAGRSLLDGVVQQILLSRVSSSFPGTGRYL